MSEKCSFADCIQFKEKISERFSINEQSELIENTLLEIKDKDKAISPFPKFCSSDPQDLRILEGSTDGVFGIQFKILERFSTNEQSELVENALSQEKRIGVDAPFL